MPWGKCDIFCGEIYQQTDDFLKKVKTHRKSHAEIEDKATIRKRTISASYIYASKYATNI